MENWHPFLVDRGNLLLGLPPFFRSFWWMLSWYPQSLGALCWVISKAATDMKKQLAGDAHLAAGLHMGWAMLDDS